MFTDSTSGIDIDVDIDVATVTATVIAAAFNIVIDILVVGAIVELRVRFPAGAPNVCLTHCRLLYSAP